MSEYPEYTTSKQDAASRIPEWAQQYDEGDTIHWTHPELEGVHSSEVLGFSTLYDVAWPVIEAPYEAFGQEPKGYETRETAAVTDDCHFEPFEWVNLDD